ncbi:SPOR domain-containing protein [Vibrio tritonius]|uniref:SPOR domain-containing protein n=1 Tax=Vibrio tritonius TaxID=1435069 RepID=UPI0008393144|nr:SPOR domain-containing protein [Vibrio tritonius]
MASKFQSRLVGTIVLVAFGVIILPDVLDGQKTHYKDDVASIPIKPELDSQAEQFEVLDPVEDKATLPKTPVTVTEEQTKASANKPLKTEVQETPDTNAYQDDAWLIQLMALKNADNAKTLVKDLQKRGYQAHTKQENGFTRVIVGPDVSKSKLERQLGELEKITGAKGQLLKFKPLNP